MASDESTPLVKRERQPVKDERFTAPSRVLLAGFLISIALSFTQVPLLFATRLMTCQEFYKHNAPYQGPGDRCSRSEIDAGTAQQVSIIGLTTTVCGILNLFVAGWQTRTWGPRAALVAQTACPAVRVAVQTLAVSVGAGAGVAVLQLSQLIGLVGGVSGYLLVLNTAAGEAVPPAQRTGMFGKLQGAVMLGTATGYLLGGMAGEAFGIRRPFETSVGLFLLSSLYAALFIPYIDPAALSDGKSGAGGVGSVFSPLGVLLPQKLRLAAGGGSRARAHYGTTFLALGVFMGVLATGYAPVMIQMYATAAFGFRPSQLGYLMASNSLIRGFFLIFAFPRIVSSGRRWFATSAKGRVSAGRGDALPTAPGDFDFSEGGGLLAEQEPTPVPAPVPEESGREFDLFFLRWSLVADGVVTAFTASATRGWHIYLAGFMLPLASGSAPASKGVIVEMSPSSKRADALQAMTLVENVAMLSTLGVFGFVFSAFSDVGEAHLTFYCNALVAALAVGILLFSHFPPSNSQS